MAGRIRTVKPEWLDDERLAALDDATRLLSVALVLMADDYGNGRAHPAHVASVAWTYAADPRAALEKATHGLLQLAAVDFIERYVINGQVYFHIRNWTKHQKVTHPGKPRVSGPETAGATFLAKVSGDSQEILRPDLRSPISDPKITDHDPKIAAPAASEPSGSASSPPVVDEGPRPALDEPAPPTEATPARSQFALVSPQPPEPSPIETVFAGYVAGARAQGKRAPVLTDARRKLIRARLREHAADVLTQAARGIWLSGWNVANNRTDLELAIRDAGHIERFRDLGERGVFVDDERRGRPPADVQRGLYGGDKADRTRAAAQARASGPDPFGDAAAAGGDA